jgi:hypothetical protein
MMLNDSFPSSMAAKHRWTSPEPTLPQIVADDGDASRTHLGVGVAMARRSIGRTPITGKTTGSRGEPESARRPVRADGVRPGTKRGEATERCRVRQGVDYRPDDNGNSLPRLVRERSQTISNRDGSVYGNGRNSTPLTTVNTAVVAPIPSASVARRQCERRVFRSVRTANVTS